MSYKSIVLQNDPVSLPPSKMSKSNPRRYYGNVMRMPIYAVLRDNIIRTGL
jgi:hypothetical protein